MKYSTKVFIVIVSLSLLGIPNISQAKIKLKPIITVGVQRDSNFYRTEENERAVYSYYINPGILIKSETQRAKFQLGYILNANYYSDDDTVPAGEAKADDDNYIGHAFNFLGSYRTSARTGIGLGGSYYRTRDEGHSDQLSNIKDRRLYSVFRLTPRFKWDFQGNNRYVGEIRYRYTKTDYDEEQYEDSNEHRIIADFDWMPRKTWTFDLQYQHWDMNYDGDTPGYQADQAKLYLQRQWKGWMLEGGVGYQNRRFDDDQEDLDEFVWSVTAESGDIFEIANRKAVFTVDFRQNLNDIDGGEGYYLANRLTLNSDYYFIPDTLKGSVMFAYQNSSYERGFFDGRDDDTYDISGKIRYGIIRWLYAEILGGYEKRDSNLKGFDYDNTYIALNLGSEFDVSRFFESKSIPD